MDDKKLIALVRKHAAIYDSSHPQYGDNLLKFHIWKEIGAKMQIDDYTCKSRWNNIRDNYRKSLKKTARPGSRKLKLYKYWNHLDFIKPHLWERAPKDSTVAQQYDEYFQDLQKDEEEQAEVTMEEAEEPPLSEMSEDLPASSSKGKRRKSKKETLHEASSKILDYLMSMTSQDPVDVFLAGVAPTLKSLNPYLLNLAKSEIFATVQKYEMKMLTEQNT